MIQALCRTVEKSKTTSINHCNFPKCAKIHKTRVKEIQRIYYTCPTYSKCFEALTIYFKKANSILSISSVEVDYGGPWPVPLFHHHVEVIKCKKSAKEMRRLCDWRRCILMYTVMRMGPSWKNVCCSETNCARVCVCVVAALWVLHGLTIRLCQLVERQCIEEIQLNRIESKPATITGECPMI